MRRLAFALVLASAPTIAQPVPTSPFRSVQLLGGGEVEIHPGARQSVSLIAGDPAITGFSVDRSGQLKIATCRRDCPARYRMKVLIVSPQAPDAAISGGGKIAFASGFAPTRDVAVAIQGGGLIEARPLQVHELTAAVNGGGAIAAGRVGRLTAAINGGGKITYEGDAEVTQAVHGGGLVSRSR